MDTESCYDKGLCYVWLCGFCGVGIATGYGLEFRSKEFSLFHVVRTGSGAHPAFYRMGTGGSFTRGVKRLEREADQSSPISAEVKKTWIYTSTPPYAFMA
jgi:hypothetical protein